MVSPLSASSAKRLHKIQQMQINRVIVMFFISKFVLDRPIDFCLKNTLFDWVFSMLVTGRRVTYCNFLNPFIIENEKNKFLDDWY